MRELMAAAVGMSGERPEDLMAGLEPAEALLHWGRAAADWRSELPPVVRRAWPTLGVESRLALYLAGQARADAMIDAGAGGFARAREHREGGGGAKSLRGPECRPCPTTV